ncbi:MAG TPA: TIGR04282 family arsenosugar biosynthesis glycosyltransferase [Thermoanaerobaculia bacterium]|nr:TIGR04282 family arsenosugar biosynthesis glycosyltransferase [Thermoanaerobaculia bacterium]
MFPTVPPPPQRLLVFARLPELGKVKTRLAADIGPERALAVYEAMLHDLLGGIGNSTEDTEIEFLWPPTPAANGAALRRAFAHHAVAMQTGPNLGDRLAMALSERFFFHKTQKIVVIGVDDPTLDRRLIDYAFALLDSCEYVIGPADDGGYYLLGCRALAFDTTVFMDIDWGTATVFDTTMERIAAIERTVAVLPERYDLDTGADLERYAREGSHGELERLLQEWEER